MNKIITVTALMLACASALSARPVIIAHRCGGGLAPENSVVGAKKSWALGADFIEIDVRLTKDNTAVLVHDDNIMRYTGIDMRVEDATFAQLRSLNFGSYFGPEFKGTKIATVQEILATVPKGKHVMCDMKAKGPKAAEIMAACIRAAGTLDNMVIHTGAEDMANYREIFPTIKGMCDLNAGNFEEVRAADKKLGYICVIFNGYNEKITFGDKAAAAGLTTWAWTIDDLDKAKELLKHHVSGIITRIIKQVI